MSGQKKKSPIIAIVAAVLLVAGGAAAYFVTQKPDAENKIMEQSQDMAASSESTTTEQAAADVDTAAGTPSAKTKAEDAPEMNTDGMEVEPGNPIVAKVDGKEITRVDVYRFIQTMPANVQQMPAVAVYPMAMEQVINTRIVQNEAMDSNIEDTPEYKKEMEIVKQQVARNLYLQKQVDAKITDKMVKNAYNDYVKQIPEVEERRARHILLETEDKAKAAIAKLKTGEKFEDLAKALSVGPTAPKGGDLGYFAKAEMVPEFANAAFGMEKGAVLEAPVKTQFGYHIIQLVDIRDRAKPTIEQMTPSIRTDLSRKALDDLIKDLRKDAKIEQFDINGKPLKEGANVIGIVPPKEDAKSKNEG